MSIDVNRIKFRNLKIDWENVTLGKLPKCIIPKTDSKSGVFNEWLPTDLLVNSISMWGEDDMNYFLKEYEGNYSTEKPHFESQKNVDKMEMVGAKILYAMLRHSGKSAKEADEIMNIYFDTPSIEALDANECESIWLED